MLSARERYDFTQCLRKLAPYFYTANMDAGIHIGRQAETALHEVCHMVTLGIPFTGVRPRRGSFPSRFESDIIEEAIAELSDRGKVENEIRTLAAEVRVLREVEAFIEGGESIFLLEVQRSQIKATPEMKCLRAKVGGRIDSDQCRRDAVQVMSNILCWADKDFG